METDKSFQEWLWSCDQAEVKCNGMTLRTVRGRFNGKNCRCLLVRDSFLENELEALRVDKKNQRVMLGSLTHELRTPLAGMVGMLEVMGKEIKSAPGRRYLKVAKTSTEQMMMLVQDILDFAQNEASAIKINVQKFNIRQAVNECVDLVAERYESKKISLISNVNLNVPRHLASDKLRYKQILLNLLSNALKFTSHGSVTISLKCTGDKHHLVTDVTDTGTGIKPEDIPKLFKLFGKLDATKELNPQGVGFGLSVCKKLSEHLGGDIGVTSIYGSGSTFTFSILDTMDQSEENKGREEDKLMVNVNDISLQECNNFTTEEEGAYPQDSRSFFPHKKPQTERDLAIPVSPSL